MEQEPAKKHVVILVPGIRDRLRWTEVVIPQLTDDGFIAAPTNMGRIDLVRFLLPFPYFRNAAANRLKDQINTIVYREHVNADHYSIIAHSFGTYLVGKVLSEETGLKVHRIIFCGSVLRYDFPFSRFIDQFSRPILNEVGTDDVWPAVAESLTWGYGSGGTYGFNRPLVVDRWHEGKNHHLYLNAKFCHDYWTPFLERGKIVRNPETLSRQPWWLKCISLIKIKYLISASLVLALALGWAQISERLSNPSIVVADGYTSGMIFSGETMEAGGTNVSDIVSIIRDMVWPSDLPKPIIHPVHVYEGWDEGQLLFDQSPDILVIHNSAFSTITADPNDSKQLARISELFGDSSANTQIILYSRVFEIGEEETYKDIMLKTYAGNVSADQLHILALDDPKDFRQDSNAKRLRDMIRDILEIE